MLKTVDAPRIGVKHDFPLAISLGANRKAKTTWRNKSMMWSELLGRLSVSTRTAETHAEYMKMSRDQQAAVKDLGGFVGGYLADGRRIKQNLTCRQIVTLDGDHATKDTWHAVTDICDFAAVAMYSTHKHTPADPRYRVVIPLDREVTADEYEAIARRLADEIGMKYWDKTTFEPTRLMYWPSHSSDIEPVFEYMDGPALCADDVLAKYDNWTDASFWPVHPEEIGLKRASGSKQKDPLEKSGIIGAFCRAHDIHDAIEMFLPNVYTRNELATDRYTFTQGTTANGAITYDDKFLFSHHGTDPASGVLCNAFDLVRIHLFGEMDEGEEGHAKSQKAMEEFAGKDSATIATLDAERREHIKETFNEDEIFDPEKLARTKEGAVKPTALNLQYILLYDPEVQGIRLNRLTGGVEATQKLPWKREGRFWRNADDAQLYMHLCQTYGVQFPKQIFQTVFEAVCDTRAFNPLKDYLNGLPEWDGVHRIDTLLIDYLGAPDDPLTRSVTRKSLIACVRRALHPGCKHDTALIINGPQGIGKSTLLRKLGGEWFSDSLSLEDTRDKTGAEKLQGVWIMEIGEMQGARKADVNAMKGFISCAVDEYRAAYAARKERRPRTCVLFGTTNSQDGFLTDTTGNRRFWPVEVKGGGKHSVWDLTEEDRTQIWGESKAAEAAGEPTYLTGEEEAAMAIRQKNALVRDARQEEVEAYLDTLLPGGWDSWNKDQKFLFFHGDEVRTGTELRKVVTAREIWEECFGRPWSQFRSKQDGAMIRGIMAAADGWEYRKISGGKRLYHRVAERHEPSATNTNSSATDFDF